MREFLDAILTFIGSESLTDDEFETVEPDEEEYSEEVYLALKTVLEARENVSLQTARLQMYFEAAGLELSDEVPTPSSNILIGMEV